MIGLGKGDFVSSAATVDIADINNSIIINTLHHDDD
jgi:hypothetical protein